MSTPIPASCKLSERFPLAVALLGMTVALAGCNSILNSWLDPTTLGKFDHNRTMEIRTSLTIEDTPPGIPGAVYPTKEDLELRAVEYPISAGDTLLLEIYELRERLVPYQMQSQVSATGMVNLPVLGRIQALGLTVPEFEMEVADELRQRDILRNPEVTVNPLYLHKSTYSIFGIGASASADAALRAGTFPLRKPDTRVLEAINTVGGLNEFVTDVYIFRYEDEEPVALVEPPPQEPFGVIPREEPFESVPVEEEGEAAQPTPEGEVVPAETGPANETEPVEPDPAGDAKPAEPDTAIEGEPAEPGTVESGLDDPQAELEGEPAEPGLEAELIEAVVPGDEDESKQPTTDDIPPDLQAEPTQPWIWVNHEFVRNPAFEEPKTTDRSSLKEVSSLKEPKPAINWARIAGESNYRILRIPADALRSGDPEFNIFVRSGDVIRIVSGEIGVYYVMGQVARPGAFGFGSEPITLKRAIAMAGGLAGLAWPDRCTIYRRIGQREQMIQVDLDRIFAGKDPDFFIKRSDIINVGTHPFAPFLQRIRAWTLPSPSSTVGYSFRYSRNFADIDTYSSRRNPHNEPDQFPNLFP